MKMFRVLTSLRDWIMWCVLTQGSPFAMLRVHPGLSSCIPYGNWLRAQVDLACVGRRIFRALRDERCSAQNHENASNFCVGSRTATWRVIIHLGPFRHDSNRALLR